MKLRKNDQILVIRGKDRGKKGKITQVFPKEEMVVVEGINKKVKHVKQRRGKEKGERVEFNAPLHTANVMIICAKCNKLARIGYKIEKGKKQRICKVCKEIV